MAVQTTGLGFKKPDGNEMFKSGDEVIAHNAQKAEDLFKDTRSRVGQLEASRSPVTGGFGLAPDPDHPGLYFIEPV